MAHRVAIVGGGMAGLAAAYQLTCNKIPFTLFEAGHRLGGTVETERTDGFVLEGGPDGWVSDKPWARKLAIELGLGNQLIASNDATRVTWILRDGALHAIPEGMRMMVPINLEALRESDLFSPESIAAYEREPGRAAEFRAHAEKHAGEDESVANFTRRHFGEDVTRTIAAPLLAGVFGGNIETLSAHAVMPQFVAMEREHGSLIAALQSRANGSGQSIFTSLRGGVGTLVDAVVRTLDPADLRLRARVTSIRECDGDWLVTACDKQEEFSHLFLATPAHVTRSLLAPLDAEAAALLQMDASSAVLVAFAYGEAASEQLRIPRGFGALVPPGTAGSDLLAATFVDQKFPDRAPEGCRVLRAFFGSSVAERMQDETDETIAALARAQMEELLKQCLPDAKFTLVRRWPQSLPQYALGHVDRMRRLQERVALHTGLTLLGNAYRGVGLPDLIRDGRAAANSLID